MVKRFMDITAAIYVPTVKRIEVKQLGIKRIVRVHTDRTIFHWREDKA